MWVADEVPVLSRGGLIMTQAAAASHVSIQLDGDVDRWKGGGGGGEPPGKDRSDYSTLVGVGTWGGGGGGGTSVV